MAQKSTTWIDLITLVLKEPEDRRMQAECDRLVVLNREAAQTPHWGFLYQGLAYRHSSCDSGARDFPGLHSSLTREVERYLQGKAVITNEIKLTVQALRPLLEGCGGSLQDVRDVLPECLVAGIQSLVNNNAFNNLPRTREPAFHLDPLGRAMRQYKTVLPKIEAYTAARFLF